MTASAQSGQSVLVNGIILGAVAGLIGGSVFGVMMATGGMLPMVAGLIGASDPVLGFVVHMLISAIIGAVYGFIAPRLPNNWIVIAAAGIIYGIIWWVLGALVIMPVMLGMGEMVLQVGEMQSMSLIGHIIFGLVTAGFFAVASARAA